MARAWFVIRRWISTRPKLTVVAFFFQGRTRLKAALTHFYSPLYGKLLNAENEIAITTGATAGILSALMAFVEAGDEVIVIEPFFNL